MEYVVISIVVFAGIPLLQWLFNVWQYRKTKKIESDEKLRKVSVLIPARNEEKNIRKVLESVLAYSSPDLEVIVADDHSSDQTVEIVDSMAQVDSRLKLVHTPDLPNGWGGKMHACHHLAKSASHPWLLFLDADVKITSDAIPRMVMRAESVNADMLSGFPNEITKTLGEKLLIPLIHFVLLGFLSILRMRKFRSPAYAASCGQVILCKRDVYFEVGGHAAIKDSTHDGLDLPRQFRSKQKFTDLADLSDVIECRMYHSTWGTMVGLEKNAKRGMGSPQLIFIFTFMLLGGQVLPWIMLVIYRCELSLTHYYMLLGSGLSGYLIRFMHCALYKCSWIGALLHPIGVCVLMGVQWTAFIRNMLGIKPTWKGRKVA